MAHIISENGGEECKKKQLFFREFHSSAYKSRCAFLTFQIKYTCDTNS